MNIDFNEALKELDGTNVTDTDKNGNVFVVTFGRICLTALTTPLKTDAEISGEESFKRLELARKINNGGKQDIDASDAILIRDRAAKLFSILISGQVYEKLR